MKHPKSGQKLIIKRPIEHKKSLKVLHYLKIHFSDDESLVLTVCQYYDGEESRACGTIIGPGETRCAIHNTPDYNQPMEMIKNMKEIEPGRAFSIMKDVIMEVPRPKKDNHATYANSYNGDTKSFMNSFTKERI